MSVRIIIPSLDSQHRQYPFFSERQARVEYLTNVLKCFQSIRAPDSFDSEKYFSLALQIEPLNTTAAYQLANIQFNRGDALGAKNTLQNALIASPNPESLWLGVKIERILGNKDNEASYAIQLRKLYPNSVETQQLINSQP